MNCAAERFILFFQPGFRSKPFIQAKLPAQRLNIASKNLPVNLNFNRIRSLKNLIGRGRVTLQLITSYLSPFLPPPTTFSKSNLISPLNQKHANSAAVFPRNLANSDNFPAANNSIKFIKKVKTKGGLKCLS